MAIFTACGRTPAIDCMHHHDCGPSGVCTLDGRCEQPRAVCSTDRECGTDYKCVDFRCVSQDACESDFQCLPGTHCVLLGNDPLGRCLPMRDCPTPCGAGEYCSEDFRCIAWGHCGSDLDCPTHEHCVFGTCSATSCTLDTDCVRADELASACIDAICHIVPECDWDQDCHAGFFCSNGQCARNTNCTQCAPPASCIGQICKAAPND